ncbi:Tyrosine-protein kinase [Balamuthia mandrillaris]
MALKFLNRAWSIVVVVVALLSSAWVSPVGATCHYLSHSWTPAKPAPGDSVVVTVDVMLITDAFPCTVRFLDHTSWSNWGTSNVIASGSYYSYFNCDSHSCSAALYTDPVGIYWLSFRKNFKIPTTASQPSTPLYVTIGTGGNLPIDIPFTPGFNLRAVFSSVPSTYTPGGASALTFQTTLYNDGPYGMTQEAYCDFEILPNRILGLDAVPSLPGCQSITSSVVRCSKGSVAASSSATFVFTFEGFASSYREIISLRVLTCTGAPGKRSNPAEITAGEQIQLKFNVDNLGPSESFSSRCIWTFPSDISLLSVNSGCSASFSDSLDVTCDNMNLLIGTTVERNLLLQLSAGTELSTIGYEMKCFAEGAVSQESWTGSLVVNMLAEDVRVELAWLNPPNVTLPERQEDEGDTVEFDVNIKSTGPSWARNVTCSFNFTHYYFDWDYQQAHAYVLRATNFTSSLPSCSELSLHENATTKHILCDIGAVSTMDTTRFAFSLTSKEPLANLSVQVACGSDTNNNFSPVSWEATYDVVNGKVRYIIVPPEEPSDSSSLSSSTSTSLSSSTSSSGGNDGAGGNDAKEEDDEPIGEKPEFIAGLSVGLFLLLLLIVAIIVALLVLRKRKESKKKLTTTASMLEMDDVSGEYGYKVDVEKGGKKPSKKATKQTGDGGIAWEISFEDLEFEKEIGRGAFGVVWRGTWRDSEVAIKRLNITRSEQIEAFKAEAELMKRLRPHGNVLLLMGVCTEEHHPFCLVTEYLPEGNLRSFLRSDKGQQAFKEDEKTFLRMAREIAAGMNHLHSEGITHRDLACRNLLLTANLSIKVADFGLACEHEDVTNIEEEIATSSPLPLKWIAPECLKSRTYSNKADVWSYGVTLWEMANGGADPYPGMSPPEAAMSVYEGGSPDIPSTAPQVIQDIMKQCFSHDPQQRPTFKEILQQLKAAK